MPKIDQNVRKLEEAKRMYTPSDFAQLEIILKQFKGPYTMYDVAVSKGFMKKVKNGTGYVYDIIGFYDGFDTTFSKFHELENLWEQYTSWKLRNEFIEKKKIEGLEDLVKGMNI
jgi:hypothetical protein